MTNTTSPPSVSWLFLSIFLTFLSACTALKNVKNTNAFIQETSPYLRQHAHNPVNWLAWNDKTLQRAKDEQKLMLISIGYAACHWCHVMERETFSDTAVAKLMNTHYISVKIDREERPDIDNLYMTACQLTKESGCGWPLNIIALPDGKPVWVGTYTPKNEWIEALSYFVKAQKNELPKLTVYAEQLQQGIQRTRQIYLPQKNNTASNLDKKDIPTILENILKTLDFENGGQKGSPKFPMPALFDFGLQISDFGNADTTNRNPKSETRNILRGVTLTLDKIANSGIYDHLGGGFARYATDSLWQIPHFEKMLYDNGQLVSLYSHAFQVTRKPLYEKVIRQTMAFVEQNWLSEEGGFYSSFDADSPSGVEGEGGEGNYYTWTKHEIDSLLGKNATIFNNVYGITEGGNWEAGKNILSMKKVVEVQNLDDLNPDLNTAKTILLKARNKRPKPNLDDKIITAWNALMLKGYIDAYKALGEPKYLEIALKNAAFINKKLLQKDGSLYRHYTKSKVSGKAFLEDYAFTIQAFIALYEVTFDVKWLFQADKMTVFVFKNFNDTTTGLFNFSDNRETPLAARPIPLIDDVIPNANASFTLTLNHLGTLLDKKEYTDRAVLMMQKMYETAIASGQTAYYYTWAKLFLTLVKPPFEVAIVGKDSKKLRDELMRYYLPNAVILGGNTEGVLPLLENKLNRGETYIYVCQNKACKKPVKTVAEALQLLNK
jgi:hypothetical protein